MTRTNLAKLKKMVQQGKKISMLTCYDYSMAVLLQRAGVDSLLVGDSLAQVVLGYENTLPADMETMLTLTKAVRRGAGNVFLMGDMPFMSYHSSIEQAVLNAGRFMAEAGCDAVKLEVSSKYVKTVERIADAGIPVFAHLGFKPQTIACVDKIVETREMAPALKLIDDCRTMIEAGAAGLLLECVAAEVAKEIAAASDVPVISCGSGPHCHGQVLVMHEALGLPGAIGPVFAKRFGEIGEAIEEAAKRYAQEVSEGTFPTDETCYHMQPKKVEQFRKLL